MEILIFLFALSNTILVRSDDNVAMESEVSYQETYKVHPDAEDTGHHQAESYQNVAQGYGSGDNHESHEVRQNKFQINVQSYPAESHLVDNSHNDVKYTHDSQNYQEIQQHLLLPNDLRQKTLAEAHGGQSVTYVKYPQQQQIYLQHYPHHGSQIHGAQAAHLKHINENDGHKKTIGFSSYVEHVSNKEEEEEVKSALKEGSVGDLKRLVPKSGISFKIYHQNDKSGETHTVSQNGGHQTNFLYTGHGDISQSHKLEVPLTTIHAQTTHHEFHQPVVESSQQVFLKNDISEQQHLGSSHHTIQTAGIQLSHTKGVDLQGIYHTQIQGSSQRPPLSEKSSSVADSNYNIQVQHGKHGHVTSNIQYSKNLNSYSSNKALKSKENLAKEFGKIQYRKHFNYPGGVEKAESLKKSLKQLNIAAKPIEKVRYEINPHIQADAAKLIQNNYVSHGAAKGYINAESLKGSQSSSLKISHATVAPYVSIEPTKGVHTFVSHTTASPNAVVHVGKDVHGFVADKTASQHVSIGSTHGKPAHFATQSTSSPYVGIGEEKVELGGFVKHTTASPIHLSSHLNIESPKTITKGLVSHTAPSYTESHTSGHLVNTHIDAEALKGSFGGHISTSYDIGAESLKTGHDSLLSHVTNTYIDAESTKGSQNNFDHQKALEGSTSFDIKNAIGNVETSHHETVGYVTPTPDIQHVENVGKQTLTYLVPKIPALPTPAAVISEHIHDASLVEAHQSKNFGHGALTSHAYSYPAVSLPIVPEHGKYFSQPQTILWASDHLQKGNALTANDFHQSLVKLHLPKDTTTHHIKTSNFELPTSFLSHTLYANQKQPVGFYHDLPVVKHTQEIHFSPKKNHHMQTIRGTQLKNLPLTDFDWNIHKSKLPSVKLNTVLLKPELMTYVQEPVKKIIPILVKKRKNRSNKDVGVIYGKMTGNRGPVRPGNRQEKNLGFNLRPEASNVVKIFDNKGDRKNEFSVSASYKVDRSLRNGDSS